MACRKSHLEEAPRDARLAGSPLPTPPPSEKLPSSSCEPKFANPRPTAPSAAAPPRRTFFDPWNSSGTGHQRAENRVSGSASWRVSRNLRLGEQYRAGIIDGRKRVADTAEAAGSHDSAKQGRNVNPTGTNDAKKSLFMTGGHQSRAGASSSSNKASRNLPQGNHVEVTEQPSSSSSSNHEQIAEQGTSAASLHRHAPITTV